MSGYLGNAWGNQLLAAQLSNQPGLWLALHVAEPTPADTPGTEVVGGGYSRQAITFGNPAAKTVTNTNNFLFPGMPASAITWVSVRTARVGGLMIVALPINEQDIAQGGQFLGAVGDVAIQL